LEIKKFTHPIRQEHVYLSSTSAFCHHDRGSGPLHILNAAFRELALVIMNHESVAELVVCCSCLQSALVQLLLD